MAEPEKQQFGDGRDNYAGAARQLSDAGKLYQRLQPEPQRVARGGQSFQQRGRYGTPCLRYSHVFVCFFSYL